VKLRSRTSAGDKNALTLRDYKPAVILRTLPFLAFKYTRRRGYCGEIIILRHTKAQPASFIRQVQNLLVMKSIYILITGLFFMFAAIPCSAQRDANTASARAAYSAPSSFRSHSAKNKKKKSKAARKVKRQNMESVLKKRPVGM
jgi:hypothetical protein